MNVIDFSLKKLKIMELTAHNAQSLCFHQLHSFFPPLFWIFFMIVLKPGDVCMMAGHGYSFRKNYNKENLGR